ncbi:MAG: ATP-binding protein [Bacteroidetes bacterium]|nr:ATP-binding protein [Bacteroidota bacterium]
MEKPKRILILGPESSGKSTLAEALAQHFQEPWVPEVARQYLQDLNRPYDFEDLLHLGKQQMRLEDEQASKAKSYLFCDTDLRVIQIWSLHRFGKIDPWVQEELGRRTYDLILLCAPDLPWQADPLREHPLPEHREGFFEQYLQLAKESGISYRIISGNAEQRVRTSLEAIHAMG